MRVLPITNPHELREVVETIMRNSLADPEKEQLIEALIADPEASRRQLVHTAFALGVTTALHEVIQGHVIGFPSKEN